MDPVTHSAAGAFIAWALPRRWAVAEATPVAVAGALLPDVDLYIEPFLKPGSAFEHRAFTHSLFGIAVLAPLIALVHLWRNKERRYARFVAVAAMGMLSHVVLDLPTELGAKVLYPFYDKIVYVDWLGHIDFTFFMLALFVLLSAWTYANREAAVRRGILFSALLATFCWWLFAEWPISAFHRNQQFTLVRLSEASFRTVYPLVFGGMLLVVFVAFARKGWGFRQNRAVFGRIGLAAFCIYLLICGAAKWVVLSQIKHFTEERGIVVLALAADRADAFSFVAPLRWTGSVLAPEGVYRAEISPFSHERPAFMLYPNAAENLFVAKSRTLPLVQGFLSEARFPVSCYQMEGPHHIVEFYDHSGGDVARVVFNEQLEVLAVRWVPIRDYTSEARPSQTALPHKEVGPNALPQVSPTPCFLH
jgi:membrane-bound metal-dependent hydrolase YbcI (DUF457 family)